MAIEDFLKPIIVVETGHHPGRILSAVAEARLESHRPLVVDTGTTRYWGPYNSCNNLGIVLGGSGYGSVISTCPRSNQVLWKITDCPERILFSEINGIYKLA